METIPHPAPDAVEKYRQELLQAYRQQRPGPAAPSVKKADALPRPKDNPRPEESSQPEDHSPPAEGTPPQGRPARPETIPDSTPEPIQAPPPGDPAACTGSLRVYAATANGAEPLENARVTVCRNEEGRCSLFAGAVTDRDGFTSPITLPAVSPDETLTPGSTAPYIAYTVRVEADGFSSAVYENIPVYGGSYVTQPALLVPLLPGEDSASTRYFPSGGPADL